MLNSVSTLPRPSLQECSAETADFLHDLYGANEPATDDQSGAYPGPPDKGPPTLLDLRDLAERSALSKPQLAADLDSASADQIAGGVSCFYFTACHWEAAYQLALFKARRMEPTKSLVDHLHARANVSRYFSERASTERQRVETGVARQLADDKYHHMKTRFLFEPKPLAPRKRKFDKRRAAAEAFARMYD